MVKTFILLGFTLLLIFGCDKSEIVNDETPYVSDLSYTMGTYHYSWFKGIITDSLGSPVSGIISLQGTPCNFPIGVENGAYKMNACRVVGGKNAFAYPDIIQLKLWDTLWNPITSFSFNSDLLIEDDTVVINFQL